MRLVEHPVVHLGLGTNLLEAQIERTFLVEDLRVQVVQHRVQLVEVVLEGGAGEEQHVLCVDLAHRLGDERVLVHDLVPFVQDHRSPHDLGAGGRGAVGQGGRVRS